MKKNLLSKVLVSSAILMLSCTSVSMMDAKAYACNKTVMTQSFQGFGQAQALKQMSKITEKIKMNKPVEKPQCNKDCQNDKTETKENKKNSKIKNIPVKACAVSGAAVTTTKTKNKGITVNITSVGNTEDSIKVSAKNISLKKNTEYVLSFDYSSTNSATASLQLLSKGKDKTAIVSDNVAMTGTVQHYETTFVAPSNAKKCTFNINLGNAAFVGSTVTIENLQITKKVTTTETVTPSVTPEVTITPAPTTTPEVTVTPVTTASTDARAKGKRR